MNDLLCRASENPQASEFEILIFNGVVNDQNAQKLINSISAAHAKGKKGVWVGIQSGGGVPGAARYVHEFLSSIQFPAIAHINDVFSEGSSLAAAFPYRTISQVGKIGFHQAAMTLSEGGYGEAKLSDLLEQVKGHNRAMVEHLALSLKLPTETVKPWVFDGRVFVGKEAVLAGIANNVLTPHHPDPGDHNILRVSE